jgi:hypothetical protein
MLRKNSKGLVLFRTSAICSFRVPNAILIAELAARLSFCPSSDFMASVDGSYQEIINS